MGNSLRNQPAPTMFGELKTPVTEDVLQVGLLFAFGIIAASFIAIIPGIRGWERLWASIRVFVALWIGAVLLVCNFGSWYADSICTRTQYKAHTKPNSLQDIQAVVGLSISLRGINVTLREVEDGCASEDYERPFPGEMIDYVESFRWAPSWRQGRLDFGEFGGQFRQRYREAQYRGMPRPILRVAESFLFDGEQYRWYRKFRVAGWYTHIWLWCGFATYLLSILLFIFNIRYGACFLFLTGSLLGLASFTYGIVVQNDPPLKIPFQDGVLQPTFNYSFYLTTITGGLTMIAAIAILVLNWLWPRKIAHFFHHSLVEDDSIFEGLLEEEEEETLVRKASKVSYGRGVEGKVQRKGTLTHVRGSVRSNRSVGGVSTGGSGRSDIVLRKKSTGSRKFNTRPTSRPLVQESSSESPEVEVQLEMVTVHQTEGV